MDKLKMHSLDGVARNIELIGNLFPGAVTEVMRDGKVERAIDFDVLRQELSDCSFLTASWRAGRNGISSPGQTRRRLCWQPMLL